MPPHNRSTNRVCSTQGQMLASFLCATAVSILYQGPRLMGSYSETAGKKNRNNFQQRRRYLAPATLDTSTVHKQQNLSVCRCFGTVSTDQNLSVLVPDDRSWRSRCQIGLVCDLFHLGDRKSSPSVFPDSRHRNHCRSGAHTNLWFFLTRPPLHRSPGKVVLI
jgi:hypothetical protein